MKSILIISFSPLHRDPRVKRQVQILKNQYKITCAGYTDIGDSELDYWPVTLSKLTWLSKLRAALFLISRQYSKYYWQRREVVSLKRYWESQSSPRFDLVIANDVESLMIALHISGDSPVFLDAHEYSPRQSNHYLWKLLTAPYVDWICRKYLNRVALMSTVNTSLSQEYENNYGVKSSVIFSAPTYRKIEPVVSDNKVISLVYHGGAQRQRGLGEVINLLNFLDERYKLYLYLVSTDKDCEESVTELKYQAQKFGDRICFKTPVPTDQLPEELNQYDIGIALIQPRNFNYAHCLPNKFFEFIQARLVLASGPTPDMKELIEEFGLGITSDDFSASSLADEISRLSADDINRIKQKVHNNAKALSFEESGQLLLRSVQGLIDDTANDIKK